MAKGLRYQHRQSCTLITQFGDVELDEEGRVTNLDKFDANDLLTIDGFVDSEVFGDLQERRPQRATHQPSQDEQNQGPTDEEYWAVIKELSEKGGHLNTEGYLQMEVLTAELRERGWPPISGTRRIRITDEGREREKAAQGEATGTGAADAATNR